MLAFILLACPPALSEDVDVYDDNYRLQDPASGETRYMTGITASNIVSMARKFTTGIIKCNTGMMMGRFMTGITG